jgi:hypothetical protein
MRERYGERYRSALRLGKGGMIRLHRRGSGYDDKSATIHFSSSTENCALKQRKIKLTISG